MYTWWLDINSLVLLLRNDTVLMDKINWLFAWKPFNELVAPYVYIESRSEAIVNQISQRDIISFSVVLGSTWTNREFIEIIKIIDNILLAPVWDCCPLSKIWETFVSNVNKWYQQTQKQYTDKWNLYLIQDYYFDTIIVD